jgi:hypothetical protein
LAKTGTSPQHIIIETTSTENGEKILKAERVKKNKHIKVNQSKITPDLSMETLKARRAWSEVFCALNENKFSPRIPYPQKLSFKIDRAIKIFHDKQATTTEYSTRNSAHRR